MEERTERRQRYRVAAPDVGQHSFSGSPAVAVSYGEPSTEKEKSRPTLRNGAVRDSNERNNPSDSELSGRCSLDPLRLYLSEIRNVKRLSRDEIEVAQQIAAAHREIDQGILSAPGLLDCVIRIADRLRLAGVESEASSDQDDFGRTNNAAVDPEELLSGASISCATKVAKLQGKLDNLAIVLREDQRASGHQVATTRHRHLRLARTMSATLSSRARQLVTEELEASLAADRQASIAEGNCGARCTTDPLCPSLVAGEAAIGNPPRPFLARLCRHCC